MLNYRTLVLNIDYSALKIITWQRAITLEMLNNDVPELGLEVVEYYKDKTVRSAGGKVFKIPSIMKTTKFIKKRKKVPLKKRNVFNRDKYMCVYCGRQLSDKNITIDHVVSRHEWRVRKLPGNPHCWTNVVSSCKSCNFKKGSLSVESAGLKLSKKPVEPSYNDFLRQSLAGRDCPNEWKVYL